MCQDHSGDGEESPPQAGRHTTGSGSDFPWELGVFDAHCHPTDKMTSVPLIPNMKARALTVMSTRSQDQELVFTVALEQGVTDGKALFAPQASDHLTKRVVPCFGWHPWFSYQLYDDSIPDPIYNGSAESKIAHYDNILVPAPSSKDPAFSAGLQDPQPLSEFIRETRARLEQHPLALVGEIGVDKAFKLPELWTETSQIQRNDEERLTPGGREGRRLSPHSVSIPHQTAVLKAQLQLAGELNRAVSVHGAQAHGMLYNTIAECWRGHEKEVVSRRQQKRVAPNAEEFAYSSDEDEETDIPAPKVRKSLPYPPRICLHSFSGPIEVLKQYTHPSVPAKIFFSFSVLVNWGETTNQKVEAMRTKIAEVIKATPDNRILIESDLHAAGDELDGYLEEICRIVCDIKGWELRAGVERLAKNWRTFVFDDNDDDNE